MAITASAQLQILISGDDTDTILQAALDNTSSPFKRDLVNLLVGNTTLTAPVVTGFVVTRLTILLPAGNATIVTVKGVAADTGFPIHITDWFSVGLDPSFVSLVLNVGTQINGVRVYWT